METKFEYQVSPELAEKIALEQFDVLLRLRGVKLRYLPLALGFLFAMLLLCTVGATNTDRTFLRASGSFHFWWLDYVFAETFLWGPIGFLVGFVTGFVIQSFLRWRIVATARSVYEKMGPNRTVSWNSESITFQSPFYETKVHWRMIEGVKTGSVGVYGVSGRRAYFAIPGDAFPSNVTPVDLIQAWQSGKQQHPITA